MLISPPTFFSPHSPLSQPPPLFSTHPSQPPQHTNNSRIRNSNYKNPSIFPQFSRKIPTSRTQFDEDSNDFSSYPNNPDSDSLDTQSTMNRWWVDSEALVSRLQSCCNVKERKMIHAVVLKLYGESFVYAANNLITVYLKFGKLVEARKVLDTMPLRNVVSWTAMLNGYLRFGLDEEAFWFLSEFVESGIRANGKTHVCVMNLCSRRLDYQLGSQVHACIVKGNWRNLIVDSAVMYFYAQCGDLSGVFRVFDEMSERDVICWTTMITACSQHGCGEDAFQMFSQMLIDGFSPNEFTVCSVLKACGEEKAVKFGKQLHGAVLKKIFKDDVFIGTSLVDMYAKCGEILDSKKVFDGMRKRNTVTWTSIIAGYARNGLGEESINLFRVMKKRRIFANNLTIVSILRACGSIGALWTGKEVHAQILKNSIQSNIYVGSTLVWLYCKSGEYMYASRVLQQMPLRDVVAWTAMISGCANLGHESEALEFLKEMMGEGVEPNPFTYSSALKACAKLEDVLQGKLIHSSVNKTPSLSNVFVGSALINMYAKCGYISEAIQVFDSMPERNLVSWKAMIMGYARNGHCQEALQLMYRMQAEGIGVDDYILTTVLTACGDVEWNMEPSSEYCLQPT